MSPTTTPSWFLAQNRKDPFADDAENWLADEIPQEQQQNQTPQLSLNQILSGALGALGSGGVNFLRNPKPINAILPMLGALGGSQSQQDFHKNPANYGNALATALSITGKGSPTLQSILPQVAEAGADISQNPDSGTIAKQLGLLGAAGASPLLTKAAAQQINKRGVLQTQDKLNELFESGDDILKPRDIGSERIRVSLHPQTETVQKGFDRNIDKTNRQLEAQARVLESKAQQAQDLITSKKLSGGAAQYQQQQLRNFRNEAAKLRQGIQDPSQGTGTFTRTIQPQTPKPGSIEEDLFKVRDQKDPAFTVADRYQTQYFQALDKKDYATANQIADRMLEFRKKDPESLALKRAFTKSVLTEASGQIPNAPLDRGRQLNPGEMRKSIERFSKLTPEAKTAIFGSTKDADEYIRFLATVPDAIERGIERYRVHIGGTAGGTGARFGLDSLTSLLSGDALVNAFFNKQFDKNGQAGQAIRLIKALASDDPDVIKALSQPGVAVRAFETIRQGLQNKKEETPVKKQAVPSKPVATGAV